MLFQDVMDHTRFVSPVSVSGKQTICKVYWNDGTGLRYGGTAPVSTALLSNTHIGFVSTDRVA